MEESDQNVNNSNFQYYYENPIDQKTLLQMRIDPEPTFKKIRAFITGVEIIESMDAEGNINYSKFVNGKPIANPEGINNIMNDLYRLVNTITIHGNSKEHKYNDDIIDLKTSIAKKYMDNIYKYQIDIKDYKTIIRIINDLSQWALSRTINDGERNSWKINMRGTENYGNQSSISKSKEQR